MQREQPREPHDKRPDPHRRRLRRLQPAQHRRRLGAHERQRQLAKASEGGRAVGKEEIRAYWTRQWQEFDPHVEPLEILDRGAGTVDVRVHQLVKSLAGDVLSDSEVGHTFTLAAGLIERMDIGEGEAGTEQGPSSAFSHS